MYHYYAFGLNIESEMPLIGLAEASGPGDRVEIRLADVPKDAVGRDGGDYVVGRAEGLLRCRIEGGSLIVVDLEAGADEDFVRTMLLGELMAALLRQRGYLVLHGASVAGEGGAVAFMGDSGWGKSTLATFMARRGYTLLTDDVLAIDMSGAEPVVIPGPAHVKLNEDVGALFVDNFDALLPLHSRTWKRLAVPVEEAGRMPAPLRRLYLLEAAARPDAGVAPLHGQAAFVELLRHTRAQGLITSTAYGARHLGHCRSLLQQIPTGVLHRPRSLERLGEVVDVVEADLGLYASGSA